MGQPFDGAGEVYDQKLREVLNFFASKLQLYYSSPRLTWLLALLDFPPDRWLLISDVWPTMIVPLPSRLKMIDGDALGFFSIPFLSEKWGIFQYFLDSGHPLALDGQRHHATAASACLKIIFIYDQPMHLQSTLRVSQRHRRDLKPKRLWHLRAYLSSQAVQKFPHACSELRRRISHQRLRSGHLTFLLEKSAYSDDLLDFACHRVFRFGYLQQKHPIYMKKVIFALAKYIHRVTGETAEVRACESIWRHQRWFAEN